MFFSVSQVPLLRLNLNNYWMTLKKHYFLLGIPQLLKLFSQNQHLNLLIFKKLIIKFLQMKMNGLAGINEETQFFILN